MTAEENALQLREVMRENAKWVRLVKILLENDPQDMAADAVTVLDVWRKEVREVLDARCKARNARMEKMRAAYHAEIRSAVRASVLEKNNDRR